MPRNPIPRLRLAAQHLLKPVHDDPTEVVRHLGAVQAQDFPMSLWAVGIRMKHGTVPTVTEALDAGRILRTHVLRPTWHLVAAEDIRWMLRLSAPQVRTAMGSFARQLGITDTHYRKARRLFEKHLHGGQQATRTELVDLLKQARICTGDGSSLFLMDAELEGLICSGTGAGRQSSYALLDERVPPTSDLPGREEAAARLAQRYFTSHGPATLDDFAWWSGLPRGLARDGMEAVRAQFAGLTWEGYSYLLPAGLPDAAALPSFLLAAFDEYFISYKDRSAVIRPEHQAKAFTANGIFRPIVLEGGVAAATWKQMPAKGATAHLRLTSFDPATALSPRKLATAITRLSAFLGVPLQTT
ncbi:winged helix DNA-binding domain-containing protein [Flaviaesturariibacter amylovorans]|uniref:Winged helix DNA-binding domain-containing protein n=1 Tax=Flaviaesturariibacter amylovorans TaxID=1084520 RepID=A0ABP8GVN3_9BACT